MVLRRSILWALMGIAALLVAAVAIHVRAPTTSRFVVGLGLGAAALVLLAALLLWSSVLRPLEALQQAALAAAAGRLDTRLPSTSAAALGNFGSSLHALTEQLALAMECVATLRAREEALQRSLDHKDLLLREVHHRVKNNLQVVSSLLDLQSRAIGDRSVVEELEASQNRIRCMALVHEQLYGDGQRDRIGTHEYLKRLASQLRDCYGRQRSVLLRLELEHLQLDVDRAMTVGLLANELLCNAFRHAFPADRSGEVRLILASKGDAWVLTVADDGVGMHPERQPEATAQHLGMTLVNTLAKQLCGSVSIENHRGTCVRVTFPMAGARGEVVAA